MPGSTDGTARRSMRPPRSLCATDSGIAFDRPPAPTSWISRIGFAAPSAQHWSMTSCARRWISGLPRCTEAKSRSSALAPLPTDDAAPPPRPISIAGPPSTIDLRAGRHVGLLDVHAPHVAEPAGDHDRLVIAAQRGAHAGCELGLERAEIAEDVRAAEFVVERGRADRAFDHDVERRGDARGLAVVAFPRLLEARNAQVRNGESGEAGFRLAAAPGRAFVADLAARAGRRARERRDRRRMIVRLDLHEDVDRLGVARVHVAVHDRRTSARPAHLPSPPRCRDTPTARRASCARRCCWIIANSDFGWRSPSMIQSALKILWRQCSEFACANIISSTSVGSRSSRVKFAAR